MPHRADAVRTSTQRNALMLGAALSALLIAGQSIAATESLAFPGAEGHGRLAQGGRSGAIIAVTSLADSGPGSLRACIEADGPRNCVFRVGGTIRLTRPLMVREGSLSILGQTAPGGGIQVTIETPNDDGKNTPLIIRDVEDVIIRHLRVRPMLPNSVKNVDAFTIEDSRRVYLDHVSGSWASDENVNTHADTTDITIANSIFAEGQNKHSKCALLGSDPRAPQNITFWRNACVSNRDRNPDNNHHGGSCVEIVNNLFFNARSEWGEVFSQYPGGTPISYIGNYFKVGPSTDDTTYAIYWNETNAADPPQIFERGNTVWSPKSKSLTLVAPSAEPHLVDTPPCPITIANPLSAEEAYTAVRQTAGAFPRDAFDTAIMADLGDMGAKGEGRMVKEPGPLPAIDEGSAEADEDQDGMPDTMEASVGAREGVFDPWLDGNNDGWSNFDQIMEQISEARISGK